MSIEADKRRPERHHEDQGRDEKNAHRQGPPMRFAPLMALKADMRQRTSRTIRLLSSRLRSDRVSVLDAFDLAWSRHRMDRFSPESAAN
jgi:hypothetical protein